ncbi:MAG TPA: anti-sigma factor [Candidatus Sulfotelmatobacter sp.]|nr:anti-sigma factor [Candidatus Sulfotelmatobacter sp.]
MNCPEIRLLLHAQADGELDAANNLELERHLKTCAACVAEKSSLQSLRTALRNGELNFRAPDSLKQDLWQFVRDLKSEKADKSAHTGFNLQWLWKFLAAGATALAALVIFLRPAGISEHDAFLNEVIASHVRSLQVEHLTDVVSSDQHTVKPWFDGKIDFAPTVKDFAAQGYPLVGGRLDYLQGRNVAALVYRRNKHFINVFVWPAGSSSPQQSEVVRGYSIINRDANGLHYCFISDLNVQELADLAALLTE